jgi:hypothetical protein
MADTRGQLYTIEGVIGALVILGAVVFAMQSVVLTPSTGGPTDADQRAVLQQQAADILALAAGNDSFDLNHLVRHWSQSGRTFDGGVNPRLGYGERGPPGALGKMLNRTFGSRDRSYNLIARYRTANGTGTDRTPIVYTGRPEDSAVVATRTVTLFDNQTLTSTGEGTVELWQYDTDPTDGDDGNYVVPDATAGPLYNVVEVRLIVW